MTEPDLDEAVDLDETQDDPDAVEYDDDGEAIDEILDDEDVEDDDLEEAGDGAESDKSSDEEGSDDEALDDLEAEELDMLTDDEESETLVVDEAAEMRAIRRAELSMAGDDVGAKGEDEFLCNSCFLVLKQSQLADRRNMLCSDCAS